MVFLYQIYSPNDFVSPHTVDLMAICLFPCNLYAKTTSGGASGGWELWTSDVYQSYHHAWLRVGI